MKKFLVLLLCFASFATVFSREVGDQVYSNREAYTLIKELGEGAFGKVFEAIDSQGQHFAVKWYKGKVKSNNQLFYLYNDCEREFHRGQLFDHPNIIKAFDLFSTFSPPPKRKLEHFLILEFVPGATVYMTRKGTISFNQALIATEHLVGALRYALDKGYLHLDLHLNNLMFNKTADAMVIDLASFYSWDELVEYVLEKNGMAAKKGLQHQAKDKKLEAFFALHPHLLQQLQKASTAKPKGIWEEDSEIEEVKLSYHVYYFDRITDAVASIIIKSDLNKEKKIAIKAEIKKLAWGFKEDYEDGNTTVSSINDVLDSLSTVILASGV